MKKENTAYYLWIVLGLLAIIYAVAVLSILSKHGVSFTFARKPYAVYMQVEVSSGCGWPS